MLTGDQTNVAFMNLDELQAEQVSLMLAVDGDKAGIQFLAPAREDVRLYRAGAALEGLLEQKWGGPLLASAPVLGGVK